MESQQSVWKAALNGGIIMGLAGTIYTLAFWFLDMMFVTWRGLVWIPVLLLLLFFLLKQFRDTHRNGFASYGQILGAGAVMSLYYGLILGIMVYLLYGVIDDGLMAKQLAVTEAKMLEQGIPEAAIEAGMKINQKIMVPPVLAASQFITSFLGGTLASLILALFVKKEGNPLVD